MTKTLDEQIADCEANIERVKLAAERLWELSTGTRKRYLDAEESKVLAQLANAETRAHGELRALRESRPDEEFDNLEPKELLKRIEATQEKLEAMKARLKPKAVTG